MGGLVDGWMGDGWMGDGWMDGLVGWLYWLSLKIKRYQSLGIANYVKTGYSTIHQNHQSTIGSCRFLAGAAPGLWEKRLYLLSLWNKRCQSFGNRKPRPECRVGIPPIHQSTNPLIHQTAIVGLAWKSFCRGTNPLAIANFVKPATL